MGETALDEFRGHVWQIVAAADVAKVGHFLGARLFSSIHRQHCRHERVAGNSRVRHDGGGNGLRQGILRSRQPITVCGEGGVATNKVNGSGPQSLERATSARLRNVAPRAKKAQASSDAVAGSQKSSTSSGGKSTDSSALSSAPIHLQ